jgi:hypothetical protein
VNTNYAIIITYYGTPIYFWNKWNRFFWRGHWGDDSPHLNIFPLIPAKPVMEGAEHLTRVTLKGPRST